MNKLISSMILLTGLFIGVKTDALAQTTHYHYQFKYDESGNREKRIYIGTVLKSSSLESNTAFNEKEPIVDNFSFGEIKIYPNPTKGNLIVEIPDIETEEIRVLVFNLQGKQLIIKVVSPNTSNQINLSNLSSGMYILKIVAGQETSEWKIIKE